MSESKASAQLDSRANLSEMSDVNERVEHIVGLMLDGTWNYDTTRRMQRELAAAWGVGASTVRNYSAEASRIIGNQIRAMANDLAATALESLKRVAEAGVISEAPGAATAAVNASKALLEFAGMAKPDEDKVQKHAVAWWEKPVETDPKD